MKQRLCLCFQSCFSWEILVSQIWRCGKISIFWFAPSPPSLVDNQELRWSIEDTKGLQFLESSRVINDEYIPWKSSFTMFYRLGTTSFTIFWVGLTIIIRKEPLFFFAVATTSRVYIICLTPGEFSRYMGPQLHQKIWCFFRNNVGKIVGFLRAKTSASRWMSGAFKWPWTRQDAMKIDWFYDIETKTKAKKTCMVSGFWGEIREKNAHQL